MVRRPVTDLHISKGDLRIATGDLYIASGEMFEGLTDPLPPMGDEG